MRLRLLITISAVALIGLASAGQSQERPERRGPGGPPGGFGGGGGMMFGGGGFTYSRLFLLRLPQIQKELELVDEQLTAIQKLQEEMGRGRGGPGGPGGPGGDEQRGRGRGRPESGKADGGKAGNGAAIQRPANWYFVQAQEQNQPRPERRFGGGQPPTEEERAQFEQQRLERARQEKTKLAEILLPHQMTRLTEIFIQVAGIGALQDEDVAKELAITDAQKGAITSARQANGEAMQSQIREFMAAGGSGEAARAKGEELRKAGEAKILELLSAEQKAKLEELKGKPFELPEGALRGAFGGQGGPGGRGPGGPGGFGGRPGGPGDGKRSPREGNNPNPNN